MNIKMGEEIKLFSPTLLFFSELEQITSSGQKKGNRSDESPSKTNDCKQLKMAQATLFTIEEFFLLVLLFFG